MSSQIEVNAGLTDYLQSVSLRESELLQRLRRETAAHPDAIMQICPEQGQFMSLLVELTGARRILEVGTFTGYSALCMASALPEDGRLDTLDLDPEATAVALRYWQEAGLAERIRLHLGPALESLDRLTDQRYDMAFLDADKENMDHYYEWALARLNPGGIILIDNVLWSGRVADPAYQDPSTRALRALNQKLHTDSRISLSMLPLGDGLTLARKRG